MKKRELEGDVIVNECDFSDWYFTYGDVTNSSEDLTDVLEEEFKGKKVRITIEEID